MVSRVEARKVVQARDETPGTPEVSISIARAVDSILDILNNIPPAYRLEVLRQVEAKVKVSKEDTLIRKVIRVSRSFKISLPRKYAEPEGSYVIQVENGRLIYVPKDKGDVKVRNDKSSRVVVIPLPKWAYEAIGMPAFVHVRIEDGSIIIEPAR